MMNRFGMTPRAALRDDGAYELLVYGEIGEGDINAKDFRRQLDRAGSYSRIALRINSGGGDAFEALAILNTLRAQARPIDAYVDGVAAAAASIVAMCGDSIIMGAGATMMISDSWGICVGNAEDMQRQADALNAIDASIAQVYADRTGLNVSAIQEMMSAETWLTAAEACEKGFATQTTVRTPSEEAEKIALARQSPMLKLYRRTPKHLKAEEENWLLTLQLHYVAAGLSWPGAASSSPRDRDRDLMVRLERAAGTPRSNGAGDRDQELRARLERAYRS
jgi:ATP-dependent protease ClpP protease subunit